MIIAIALILALVWGGVWAAFLQWTSLGRFLAIRRTWITVAVGMGVDLVICYFIIPTDAWLKVAGVVVVSSIFIIARSLHNEYIEKNESVKEITDLINASKRHQD